MDEHLLGLLNGYSILKPTSPSPRKHSFLSPGLSTGIPGIPGSYQGFSKNHSGLLGRAEGFAASALWICGRVKRGEVERLFSVLSPHAGE
jgi:hypothetical protein